MPDPQDPLIVAIERLPQSVQLMVLSCMRAMSDKHLHNGSTDGSSARAIAHVNHVADALSALA